MNFRLCICGEQLDFLFSQIMSKEPYLQSFLSSASRFDLALSLGELEVCHQLAAEAGSEHKWRLVADLAQQRGDLQMAQTCLLRAHDYPGLLLQATATGRPCHTLFSKVLLTFRAQMMCRCPVFICWMNMKTLLIHVIFVISFSLHGIQVLDVFAVCVRSFDTLSLK